MLRQKQFAFGALAAGLLMFAVATTAMALVETINYKGGHESFDKALIANGREYTCQVTGAPGGTKFEWDPPGTGIVSGGGGDSDSSLTWKSDMSSRSESIGVDIYPSGEGGGGGHYHASWDAVLKDPVLSVYLYTVGGPINEAYICFADGGSQQAAADITLSGSIDIAGSLGWSREGDGLGSVNPTSGGTFTESTGDSPRITTYTVQGGTQTGEVQVKGTIKNELGAAIKNDSSGNINVFYTEIQSESDWENCEDRKQNPTFNPPPYSCSIGPNDPTRWLPPNSICTHTSFLGACTGHDICYQTCNSDQEDCDDNFYNAMKGVCSALTGVEWVSCYAKCRSWAWTYYTGVDMCGHGPWMGDQIQVCVCCDKPE